MLSVKMYRLLRWSRVILTGPQELNAFNRGGRSRSASRSGSSRGRSSSSSHSGSPRKKKPRSPINMLASPKRSRKRSRTRSRSGSESGSRRRSKERSGLTGRRYLRPRPKEDAVDEQVLSPEQEEMMKVMGFANFSTSKKSFDEPYPYAEDGVEYACCDGQRGRGGTRDDLRRDDDRRRDRRSPNRGSGYRSSDYRRRSRSRERDYDRSRYERSRHEDSRGRQRRDDARGVSRRDDSRGRSREENEFRYSRDSGRSNGSGYGSRGSRY